MSTRAIIGYVSAPGRWKGVWNHWSGHPQHLGRALIERVLVLDGDLARLTGQFIDRCSEGWSNFAEGERCDDPVGYLSGSITDEGAACADANSLALDTHFLYIFDRTARTLSVYETSPTPTKHFGQVVFTTTGESTPASLPSTEE